MPVFISYSHEDKDFATNLAVQLVRHKAKVWIDQWELHVGDSIIDRIQSAIQGADSLLIILSKTSVSSEWCKKEISSGLLRELEEKRVVVLPAIIEDCEIPLFLRGKLYADFRKSFDDGIKAVLDAISRITSEGLGRFERPEWIIDWAIDWGFIDGNFLLTISIIEMAKDQPYSALTQIIVKANDTATRRYKQFFENGIDWIERMSILFALTEFAIKSDFRVMLEDNFPKTKEIIWADEKSGSEFSCFLSSRRLGEDTGRDILLDLGGQLKSIIGAERKKLRPPTKEELLMMKRIQYEFEH
jgi:hypothetical protein